MTKDEAIKAVMERIKLLNPSADTNLAAFYVEKLVADTLDYCHRGDFPETLKYTLAELTVKRLLGSSVNGIPDAPLKALTQNDTKFEFAVNSVNLTGTMAEADFVSVQPKLNLYRKVLRPCRLKD